MVEKVDAMADYGVTYSGFKRADFLRLLPFRLFTGCMQTGMQRCDFLSDSDADGVSVQ